MMQPDLPVHTTQSKSRRVIFRYVKVFILIYCSAGIIFYYLQRKLLLHPEVLSNNYVFNFKQPFKEITLDINKNETINMIQFLPSTPRKGIVLYFHGNMENINHYAKYSTNFTKHGYEVWMPDYPGFGKSRGELTETKLYNLSGVVYGLAQSKMTSDSIIIYGKSFGTGIAAQLAASRKCKMLILETPYYSMPALASAYAPIYPTSAMSEFKLPTAEYLKKIMVPVTIFHGTSDGVIPYRSASKLKVVLKSTDQFITIDGGTHNNLNDFDLFRRKLDSLLEL